MKPFEQRRDDARVEFRSKFYLATLNEKRAAADAFNAGADWAYAEGKIEMGVALTNAHKLNDALKQENEELKESGKALSDNYQKGLDSFYQLEKERDELKRELAALKDDRDKFLASDDCYYWTPEAQKERDELKRENERLLKQYQIMCVDEASLRAELEKANKELEERRMATPKMNALHMLQAENEKLRAEVHLLTLQMNGYTQACRVRDELREELDAAKRDRVGLLKLLHEIEGCALCVAIEPIEQHEQLLHHIVKRAQIGIEKFEGKGE